MAEQIGPSIREIADKSSIVTVTTYEPMMGIFPGNDLWQAGIEASSSITDEPPPIVNETQKPLKARVFEFVFGPPVIRTFPLKPFPTRDEVLKEQEAVHPLITILPNTNIGAGRAQFNSGNPHAPEFDDDNIQSHINRWLILHNGSIPLYMLFMATGLTREDAAALQLDQMYKIKTNTDNIEVFEAPQLKKYLKELREKEKFPYHDLILATDVDEFREEHKEYLAQREEQRKVAPPQTVFEAPEKELTLAAD